MVGGTAPPHHTAGLFCQPWTTGAFLFPCLHLLLGSLPESQKSPGGKNTGWIWRSPCESSEDLGAGLNSRAVKGVHLLFFLLHFAKWVTVFMEMKLLHVEILKLELYM